MCNKHGNMSETCLQIFGKISAGVSHEIKNALAIINENAGLLEDFSLMAEKGIPLDPERIKVLASKILKQIQRADAIIKNMNRFAHSTDIPIVRVNASEVTHLIASLSGRLAGMKRVTVDAIVPDNSVFIKTNLFLLESLIYICLTFILENMPPGTTVKIETFQEKERVIIKFLNIKESYDQLKDNFTLDLHKNIIEALKAKLVFDINSDAIMIDLPVDIEA